MSRLIVLHGNGFRSKTEMKDEMVFFALVAVALAIFACINAILCMTNFNNGLKPLLLYQDFNQEQRVKFEPVEAYMRYSTRFELD